jgi:hypothetical protein
MLCCTLCGTGVCRGKNRSNHCSAGVLYQAWGPQGVIPAQVRKSMYDMSDAYFEAIEHSRAGYEEFRIVCCACHLAGDYHLNGPFYQSGACARCKVAVEGGFRNIRHHARALRMVLR